MVEWTITQGNHTFKCAHFESVVVQDAVSKHYLVGRQTTHPALISLRLMGVTEPAHLSEVVINPAREPVQISLTT